MVQYNKKTRENVFKLYATTMPIREIADKCHITTKTIYDWIKQDGWKKRKDNIEEELRKQVNQNVIEIKREQDRLVKLSLKEYERRMKLKKTEVKPVAAVHLMKHQLHLHGEDETSSKVDGDIAIRWQDKKEADDDEE